MTRSAIAALVLAAIAGNAFADSTYVRNDKNRIIGVQTPAPVAKDATVQAKPAAPAVEQPNSLTGTQRTVTPAVNDKNRRI